MLYRLFPILGKIGNNFDAFVDKFNIRHLGDSFKMQTCVFCQAYMFEYFNRCKVCYKTQHRREYYYLISRGSIIVDIIYEQSEQPPEIKTLAYGKPCIIRYINSEKIINMSYTEFIKNEEFKFFSPKSHTSPYNGTHFVGLYTVDHSSYVQYYMYNPNLKLVEYDNYEFNKDIFYDITVL